MIELNKLCPWSIILSNVSLLCHVYRVRILYSLSIPSHFLHCTVLQRCQSLFAYGYSLDVSNAAKERMRTLTRILAIRLLDVRHVTWYVCDVSHVTCKIHRSYARPRAYHVIVSLLESGSVCGPRAYHCVVSLLSSGSVRGLFSIMCWLVTGSSTNMKVDNLCYINNACWMVWMLQRLVLFWITYPTIASLPTEMYITEWYILQLNKLVSVVTWVSIWGISFAWT